VTPRSTLVLLGTGCLLAAGIGCSRALYHQRADRDAYAAIAGKSELLPDKDPLRDGGNIEPAPDSRLYDPFDPDHPPMPPDDPAAYQLTAKSSNEKGPQSDASRPVDPAVWRNLLPKNSKGNLSLDLKSAVHLGLVHSRDFQKEKERLFASAMDLTEARYQTSPHLDLGEDVLASYGGHKSPAKRGVVKALTDGKVHWVTASATELLIKFANSFLWDFQHHTLATEGSSVGLTLLQPLLGLSYQDKTLESLSFAERNLLANVRQMKQFQLGYYVRIASGRYSGEGPNPGGKVGALGLGIIAQTPGGLTGAPAAGGYLGLLEETQSLQNQESSIIRLRQSYEQLAAAFDAGRLTSRLQVDQALLALYNSQSSLLSAKAAYAYRVDSFKVDLGLPPDLPLTIEDPLINKFNTSNTAISALDRRLSEIQTKIRNRVLVNESQQLISIHESIVSLKDSFSSLFESAQADLRLLREQVPLRKKQLENLSESIALRDLQVDLAAIDPNALETRLQKYSDQLNQNSKELGTLLERLRGFPEVSQTKSFEESRNELIDIASDFSGLLLAISLTQTGTRLDTATLPAISIGEQEALAIAKERRLDWMNARARLVDTWRQVDLMAKDLKASVNFSATAGIGAPEVTTLTRAAVFDSRSRVFNAGVAIKSPLVKLIERNTYRQALIDYQQARRDYMLFEDKIDQSLRNTLRTVELCQLNFELRRAAVQVAISQVDLARLRLEEPPRPGVAAQIGATTARDLVQALSDLLAAQNAFLSMRVGYDVLRLVLDFETGTMQVDDDGIWVDPGAITQERLASRNPRWSTVARVSASPRTEPASPNLRLSFRQDPPSVR